MQITVTDTYSPNVESVHVAAQEDWENALNVFAICWRKGAGMPPANISPSFFSSIACFSFSLRSLSGFSYPQRSPLPSPNRSRSGC